MDVGIRKYFRRWRTNKNCDFSHQLFCNRRHILWNHRYKTHTEIQIKKLFIWLNMQNQTNIYQHRIEFTDTDWKGYVYQCNVNNSTALHEIAYTIHYIYVSTTRCHRARISDDGWKYKLICILYLVAMRIYRKKFWRITKHTIVFCIECDIETHINYWPFSLLFTLALASYPNVLWQHSISQSNSCSCMHWAQYENNKNINWIKYRQIESIPKIDVA